MFRTLFAVIGLLVVLFVGIGFVGAVFGIASPVAWATASEGQLTMVGPNGSHITMPVPMVSGSVRAPHVFMLLPVMVLALVLLAGLFLLIGFLALVRRMFGGGRPRARTPGGMGRAGGADDMAVMQELLEGMRRMGRRVESLETILIERGRR